MNCINTVTIISIAIIIKILILDEKRYKTGG
jgi:hypothetical protein